MPLKFTENELGLLRFRDVKVATIPGFGSSLEVAASHYDVS